MIISSLLALCLAHAHAAPPPRLRLGGQAAGRAPASGSGPCALGQVIVPLAVPFIAAPKPEACEQAAYDLYAAKLGADVGMFNAGIKRVHLGGCDELQGAHDDDGELVAELQATLARQLKVYEAVLARRWQTFTAACSGAKRVESEAKPR